MEDLPVDDRLVGVAAHDPLAGWHGPPAVGAAPDGGASVDGVVLLTALTGGMTPYVTDRGRSGMSLDHGFTGAHRGLLEGRAELPRLGTVAAGPGPLLLWVVRDEAGGEVEPVSGYLRDLALGDCSPLTCRSYAYDLLRWFRVCGQSVWRGKRPPKPRPRHW